MSDITQILLQPSNELRYFGSMIGTAVGIILILVSIFNIMKGMIF